MAFYFCSLLMPFLLTLTTFTLVDAASPCNGYAKYNLTFQALWSQETHSSAYISSAHFSPLIGASHNDSYKMWGPGQNATNGIKVMAETGRTNPLKSEITKQISMGYAHQMISGSGVNSPGTITNIQVSVTHEYPLVSVVTMIAPSPDWFVGVHGADLCDAKTGRFKNEMSFDLGPWDSGTDDGKQFDSPNAASSPFVQIFLITNTMETVFKSNVPIPKLAVMTFTKTEESVMSTTATTPVYPTSQYNVPLSTCEGSAEYELTFRALWSKETHPNAYIAGAHFSPIVGASHNSRYKMWGPGLNATEGVKIVAETGDPNPLKTEITAQINMAYAYKMISGPRLNSPGALTGIKVFVNRSYPLVSVITMIAPSPDWFVGVDAVDLCNANTGNFKENVSFNLGPWDSGTDDGKLFDSPDKVTSPPVPIFLITNAMDTVFKDNKTISTLAVMSFKKVNIENTENTAKNEITEKAPTNINSATSGFTLKLRHTIFMIVIGLLMV